MEEDGKGSKNKMRKLVLLAVCLLLVTGCEGENTKKEPTETTEKFIVHSITGAEVDQMIEDGAALIDVRTNDEFNEGHIEKAINIPYDQIAEDIPYGKDKVIIVYCRSGSRSYAAATTLVNLGYSNVYDLGSIDNYK